MPFHKAQEFGKAPKKLDGGPAPDLEEAFDVRFLTFEIVFLIDIMPLSSRLMKTFLTKSPRRKMRMRRIWTSPRIALSKRAVKEKARERLLLEGNRLRLKRKRKSDII